jgi:alkanesulfonate monooxygenase SsuD/methylene tetrahydromethanopterin reductase-like flavin-dependent oxidoreductase (luciferase family)
MPRRLSYGLAASNWTAIARYLREAGRDPTSFPTTAYHNVNLNPDRQAALEESKRFLDAYYGPVFTPAMVESWTAAGTIDECVAHLRGLREEGVSRVTLRITSWQQREQFERLVGDLLPRLSASYHSRTSS